ncbi:MAG: glycine/sarcosine/betaine reductase component B subunit [Synergistales bacterium]|nr:glycine/sarcosine/betaine reductase component B subunit [Synergistales bacterium]
MTEQAKGNLSAPPGFFALRRIRVTDVVLGEKTTLKGSTLVVDEERLCREILEDPHIDSVSLKVARPGESKRVIPVKDVIAPAVKLHGAGSVFPGSLGGEVEALAGEGTTAFLDGVGVVTSGKLVNFQEGLIDMSGPGAAYSLFSRLCNLVVVIEPREGIGKHDHERAVREAGIKAARQLGEAAPEAEEFEETHYPLETLPEMSARYRGLHRVVYVRQVLAQGLLHDNHLYGLNVRQASLPFVMTPTEHMDGALVSGNCAAPCHKHTTYHHQQDPIIEDLFAEHGKSLAFLGIIAQPVRTAFAEKKRNSLQVLKLARYLGAEGAIVAEDGGGNPESDLMLTTRLLEQAGIKTVLVTDEYAGRDGASPGLADITEEADAVVTGGNGNEVVVLPPMDETIGHLEAVERITGGHSGSLREDGSIELEIAGIMGSTNELGAENLTTRAI